MQLTRPWLVREYSPVTIPRPTSFTPSPPSLPPPSSATTSSPCTSPTSRRLRRANAPTFIALPTSTLATTSSTRRRARSDALNTPLAFSASGTVIFGIRTPTFEARTPLLDSPGGLPTTPAHRLELGALDRSQSRERELEGDVLISYFGEYGYGPVKCKVGRGLGMGRGRARGSSIEDVPPMSPETDESPAVTPMVPETPGRR